MCSILYAQRMKVILFYICEEGHLQSMSQFAELTQRDTFTWPAHPTSDPEKTKDSLVPCSSGGIKSLHNAYLDSK